MTGTKKKMPKPSKGALAYAKEVAARIQANKALPEVTETTRRKRGKKCFEYEGTSFKKYVLFQPVLYASEWNVPDPVAKGYMRIGWIDEKGRRCHSSIPKDIFNKLFVEKA